MAESPTTYSPHGIRRMLGRDTREPHRAATPLELLNDLTFVAAFGVAGNALAHGVAAGHWGPAVLGFAFSMFAIIWAWINFSWFASAFDTDDWPFRVLTMVQMAGVVVLAIGLGPMFASLEHGEVLENGTMVAGYVVMRVALIVQWLRAGASDRTYRSAAYTYAVVVGVAQLGWIALAVLPLTAPAALAGTIVVLLLEVSGPLVAESRGARRGGGSTPWHPHHIAERYSLLAIIALGETIIGTLAAAQEITDHEGWSFTSIVVVAAGIGLSFALWWSYFVLPSAHVLAVRRAKAFPWGYGHIFIFGSIAAVGAGLHLIGYVYDPEMDVSTVTVITAIAAPVLVFAVSLYLIYTWLVSEITRNAWVQLPALLLPALAIVLAAVGTPMWVCLLLVLASPVTIIVSYEAGAWRTLDRQVRRIVADSSEGA